MNSDSEHPSETPAAPAAVTSPWRTQARTFYWLLRRELWEHRVLYIAPAVVAGFGVVGSTIGSLNLSNATRAARLADPASTHSYMEPYSFVAGTVFLSAIVVSVLYCLAALHGERRERSILFWKSLPVSDRMTVLSKAAVPLLIMPVIVFAVVFAAQLVILILTTLIWLANGFHPGRMWAELNLPFLWFMLVYGQAFMILWHAPIVGWLLLVSAWARRVPFVWAVAPLAALAVIEHLAFSGRSTPNLLEHRLTGGFTGAFSVDSLGGKPVSSLADLDPARLFGQPGVWIGLIIAALFLFAAIRLRRSRGPI
ncbi:MAG: ABC transporter permease [Pseudomonadota bacterium]|nr:ABC transporter permease [Pseudomonadota bacterium]